MIYLIEASAYNIATGLIETLRFCKGPMPMTQPYETPPNAFYKPCVINPGLGKFEAFTKGATGGVSTISRAKIELANPDGSLDYLVDYAFDGRSCIVRLGQGPGAYPADFPIIETFTMDQPVFDQGKISLSPRDRQADLDISLQSTLYAGSNVLPSGLEGTAADLKDKPKPVAFGAPRTVTPLCVNTSKLIYQAGDGNADVSNVYDRAVAQLRGEDYASQADMESNEPAPGCYRVWPDGCYFRLGSTPAGQITCDVLQGSSAGDRTAAQQILQIVTRPGGIQAADICTADITALDAANSAACSLWIPADRNRRECLDELCRTVGAWWGFDRTGQFRVQRLELPSGEPLAELTTGVELDGAIGRDSETQVAWRVIVRYGRNWSPQTTDIDTNVPADRKAWLQQEWRQVSESDETILVPHPKAITMTIDSCFDDEESARLEAVRLLEIYGTPRVRYAVRLLDATKFGLMVRGGVVRLFSRRYQLAGGKLCRIIGLQPDYGLGRVDLTLWC